MDQLQPEDILEGAQAIRAHLEDLLDDQAENVDIKISALLDKAEQGRQVHGAILKTLSRYQPTREWFTEFIRTKLQKEAEGKRQLSIGALIPYLPLPGPDGPVSIKVYCCPQGDYQWPQVFVGMPIPSCPTHHSSLVLCP